MTETYDVAQIKARLLAKMGEQAADYPAVLEQFSPRILARIAELWGSGELDSYLQSLMLPERQERQGFPVAVATALIKLAAAHAALGLTPKASGAGWWSDFVESAREDKPA